MKNTNYNKIFGNKGEDIAANYLENKGYTIVKRNFKFGREGEIDIIAKNEKILIFIEVKTRTNHLYGEPIAQISMNKRRTWRRAAEGFLYINKIVDYECRFDLIGIDITGETLHIEHIENAM